jgi:signal transduction histidine kinase
VPFDKPEVRLLETLVTLAALAVRNVDLYEQSTRANQALAESNEFKDDLMAMFAHDFKGPLTVISGFSELLFDSEDPEARRNAETIVEQTRRLAKLSEDALALAATQSAGFSLQRSIADLTAFVCLAVEPLDREGNRVAVQAPFDPVFVSFDRVRLRHVIDNVVGNALKYAAGRVDVRVERLDREVCIAVADRGIGIPAEDLGKIFSRFGRAANARSRGISGSGVGLYIAKKIVEVHGGRIEVSSVENEGSTFRIMLPA